jgi:hypothetical protein
MWVTATDKPIGAIYLARNGIATVGAAGATNTSGKGGPLNTSRGVIPQDAANRYVISIEAANPGDGTPWPDVQIETYVKLCAALNKAYMGGVLATPGDVHGHFEWTDRKIDPSGQSRYAIGPSKWNMVQFRSDVLNTLTPPPPIYKGVNDMFVPIKPTRMADTREWPKVPLNAGQIYEFGLNPAIVPVNAVAAVMNITAIGGLPGSLLTVWDYGAIPNTSVANFNAGESTVNAVYSGPISNLKFNLRATSQMHVTIDVTGFWTP